MIIHISQILHWVRIMEYCINHLNYIFLLTFICNSISKSKENIFLNYIISSICSICRSAISSMRSTWCSRSIINRFTRLTSNYLIKCIGCYLGEVSSIYILYNILKMSLFNNRIALFTRISTILCLCLWRRNKEYITTFYFILRKSRKITSITYKICMSSTLKDSTIRDTKCCFKLWYCLNIISQFYYFSCVLYIVNNSCFDD